MQFPSKGLTRELQTEQFTRIAQNDGDRNSVSGRASGPHGSTGPADAGKDSQRRPRKPGVGNGVVESPKGAYDTTRHRDPTRRWIGGSDEECTDQQCNRSQTAGRYGRGGEKKDARVHCVGWRMSLCMALEWVGSMGEDHMCGRRQAVEERRKNDATQRDALRGAG